MAITAGQPSSSPSPATSPFPAGSPPSGAAIWFLSSAGRLISATWEGAGFDVGRGTGRIQSPDGSRFLARDGSVDTFDGTLIGTATPTKPGFQWADDSRHLCSVHFDSPGPPADDSVETPTTLFSTLPGSPPRALLKVGYEHGQSGPQLLACSFAKGLATIAEICVIPVCDLWTVDLLNRRVLYHRGASTSAYQGAVSSADATLVAVTGSTGDTTVLGSTDGAAIARLPQSRVVVFTADDRFALVEHPSGPAQLVDWRTGRVVVSLPGSQIQSALSEPGGSRIAAAIGDRGATSAGYPPPAELVVVGGEGQLILVASAVRALF